MNSENAILFPPPAVKHACGSSDELIKLENVSMKYNTPSGEIEALKSISFSVYKNEFVSIVGSSGCGKSTVLSIISGLLKPTDGRVLYNGAPLSGALSDVGYMLQHDQLFPWSTVEENVSLGLRVRHINTPENRKKIRLMLEDHGLAAFASKYPRELSGGMRQRAALVRTLALDPGLLLLDEPFSALDYQTRIRVSDDIAGIIRRRNKTAILVTHDISEAISLSDRIIVLSSRPASVCATVDIKLDGNSVPEKRRSPQFSEYFEIIWSHLSDSGKCKKKH